MTQPITYDIIDPNGNRVTVTGAVSAEVVNQQTLQSRATAALTANSADITQNANIATQAAAVTATTGNLTTAQLSNYVRQLAQAVTILAGNDTNAKRELTTIIRLVLGALDSTDGT